MSKIKYSKNPSVKKSQQWLYESLIELMKNHPFEKITIAEITKNADLDRTTFYRNYDSKIDILNVGINKIKTKNVQSMKNAEKINMESLSKVFFSTFCEEIEFLNLIYAHGLTRFLLSQVDELRRDLHVAVKEQFNYRIADAHLI